MIVVQRVERKLRGGWWVFVCSNKAHVGFHEAKAAANGRVKVLLLGMKI